MASWMGLFKQRVAPQPFMQRHRVNCVAEAMRCARREADDPHADVRAATDALEALFRLQLLFGSEQTAEDLVTELNHRYVRYHKREARWLMAINGAILEMHRHRPARVAELLRPFLIADAPAEFRLEAIALLAQACCHNGEEASAQRLLSSLDTSPEAPSADADLLLALRLELGLAPLATPAMQLGFLELDHHLLWQARWRAPDLSPAALHECFVAYRQMSFKAGARAWVDAAQLRAASRLIDLASPHLAESLIKPLLDHEPTMRSHPLRDELLHIRARLLAHQGRYAQAFQTLSDFVAAHHERLRRNAFLLPRLTGEANSPGGFGEAIAARLPPKYRRLMALIGQRINDPKLGVQDMAAYINVTERAIQLTFKDKLGMSPAQFIRHMRQQGLSEDSAMVVDGESLETSKQRWGYGVGNRLRRDGERATLTLGGR
ncbi:hypothetical protein [Ideonella sp.]|uniref:hypothetical protein n=1 Tax=Ideonella sp. TaxID=1929293 RepID=UPI0037BE5620